MATEIEKKYRLEDGDAERLASTLAEFNAEYLGEDHEENIIFSSSSLAENASVVRIRRIDGRAILTYKRRLPGISDLKHQIEYETEIADADAMTAILESLGLEPKIVYEKRRRKWRLRSAEVVLDVLPFGSFMEIEGSVTAIKEADFTKDGPRLKHIECNYVPRCRYSPDSYATALDDIH